MRLLSRQEHLNKINVFPVPDGDTGTNLALTMHAVLGSLQRWPDRHAGKTLTRVADAALDGARGNSGAILAQFFLSVCDRLGHLGDLQTDDFADGVDGGAAYAREIQAVRREGVRDFRALLERGVRAAQASLDRTPLQLEALRKANVVDAGAQGFFELTAGMTEYPENGSGEDPQVPQDAVIEAATEETAGGEVDLTHRYCTECVVTGERVDRRHLREVNDPAEVFRIAARFGSLSAEKADDMQRQQHSAHAGSRKVTVVTDSAADIPEDDMERLGVNMVPVRVHFGERGYLDKVGIKPEEFFAELATNPQHPKTSQPPPGDFRRQFEFLASHFEAVISINLTRRVSGTCGSAETAAARTTTHGKVTVIDSMNASVGQGLVAMYAAECAAAAPAGCWRDTRTALPTGQRLLEQLAGPNVSYGRVLPLGSARGAHGGPGMLVVSLQEYSPPA